jgi:putative SOS response-associated peptidase YedK
MCFSYSVNINTEALKSQFLLDEIILPSSGFFFSAFSYPELPVLRLKGDHIVAENCHWGLIPSWTRDEVQAAEIRKRGFNARGETVGEKPMFRAAFEQGRCLIPAAGFFEWREVNKKKYPYYIYPTDHNGFLFAGVSEKWINNKTGEEIVTYAIVTSEPNELMAMIHNIKKRMPLILDTNEAKKWMLGSAFEASTMIRPYDNSKMQAHTIATWAGNPKIERNIAEIQDEVYYPELNGLTLF